MRLLSAGGCCELVIAVTPIFWWMFVDDACREEVLLILTGILEAGLSRLEHLTVQCRRLVQDSILPPHRAVRAPAHLTFDLLNRDRRPNNKHRRSDEIYSFLRDVKNNASCKPVMTPVISCRYLYYGFADGQPSPSLPYAHSNLVVDLSIPPHLVAWRLLRFPHNEPA